MTIDPIDISITTESDIGRHIENEIFSNHVKEKIVVRKSPILKNKITDQTIIRARSYLYS